MLKPFSVGDMRLMDYESLGDKSKTRAIAAWYSGFDWVLLRSGRSNNIQLCNEPELQRRIAAEWYAVDRGGQSFINFRTKWYDVHPDDAFVNGSHTLLCVKEGEGFVGGLMLWTYTPTVYSSTLVEGSVAFAPGIPDVRKIARILRHIMTQDLVSVSGVRVVVDRFMFPGEGTSSAHRWDTNFSLKMLSTLHDKVLRTTEHGDLTQIHREYTQRPSARTNKERLLSERMERLAIPESVQPQ